MAAFERGSLGSHTHTSLLPGSGGEGGATFCQDSMFPLVQQLSCLQCLQRRPQDSQLFYKYLQKETLSQLNYSVCKYTVVRTTGSTLKALF